MKRVKDSINRMTNYRNYSLISENKESDGCVFDIYKKQNGEGVCIFYVIDSVNTENVDDDIDGEEDISMLNKLKNICYIADKGGIRHVIIVHNMLPNHKKAEEFKYYMKIEFFSLKFFIRMYNRVNDLKHELRDKKIGRITTLICKTDPVIRFLGYDSGDVIKITRNNEITYRTVK